MSSDVNPRAAGKKLYTFARDELIDALTRVETVTLVKDGAGTINAESMADALIKALTGTPVPVHYRWPVACGNFVPGELWTGNLDRVNCAGCRTELDGSSYGVCLDCGHDHEMLDCPVCEANGEPATVCSPAKPGVSIRGDEDA